MRIVRDPRDVALSLAGLPFAKESVVGNLVRVDQDDRASRDRIAADPLAMTLRYEDLVTEPERELRRICDVRRRGATSPPCSIRGRSAAAVAADHEWWKAAVAGPLTTASVGRWRREMSADAQRFAALHLADFLREHGYEGARDAAHEVAIVPGRGRVSGPHNERLLLELARRSAVVRATRSRRASRSSTPRRDLVFLGVRGQLDPSRGRPIARRAHLVASASGPGCSSGGCSAVRSSGSAAPRCEPRRPRDPAGALPRGRCCACWLARSNPRRSGSRLPPPRSTRRDPERQSRARSRRAR